MNASGATELLANLAPEGGNATSAPRLLGRVGDRAIFRARPEGSNFARLYAHRAGDAGVEPLGTAFEMGGATDGIETLAVFSERLVLARFSTGTIPLYATDGLPGNSTRLFAEGDPDAVADLGPHAQVGDVLMFVGRIGNDPALYRTDGTAAGTFQIPGTMGPIALDMDLVAEGQEVAFLRETAPETYDVSIYNVPSAQLQPFATLIASGPKSITLLGLLGDELLYFDEPTAFKRSATSGSSVALGTASINSAFQRERLGNRVVWTGRVFDATPIGGSLDLLYSSDGTAGQIETLLDVRAPELWSVDSGLQVVDDRLYLIARETSGKSALWRTDGTPA